MAKAIITIEDGSGPDEVSLEVEFDPVLTKEQFDSKDITEAQAIALLILQDLATDELGRHSNDGELGEGVEIVG